MKRRLGRRVKDFFVRAIWGNRTYRAFLKPLDRYTVEVRPSSSFGPELSLNKLCRVADSRNMLWKKGASDLLFPSEREVFHRKVWEFCQVLYGLRKLRRLCPQAVALGIACGHEELMYFLANRVKEVCATDLYEKRYLGGESSEDVLLHPEKYAPFHYRQDHLRVMRMDAGQLLFEDETFDFIFCLSSLEHFGGRRNQAKALREMFRVLKPGGVAVLTTELILNRLGSRRGYFQFEELRQLIGQSGFFFTEPVDLAIEKEYADPPLALPMEFQRTPHVILRNFNIIYTSVSLFLGKPESAEKGRNAALGPEQDAPTQPFRWSARIEILDYPERVKARRGFQILVRIENTGDAPWFKNSSQSHMVRIGVTCLDSSRRESGFDIPHFELPSDLCPSEAVEAVLRIPGLRKKGLFYLEIDLVKELCFWFKEKGSETKEVPITSD